MKVSILDNIISVMEGESCALVFDGDDIDDFNNHCPLTVLKIDSGKIVEVVYSSMKNSSNGISCCLKKGEKLHFSRKKKITVKQIDLDSFLIYGKCKKVDSDMEPGESLSEDFI